MWILQFQKLKMQMSILQKNKALHNYKAKENCYEIYA